MLDRLEEKRHGCLGIHQDPRGLMPEEPGINVDALERVGEASNFSHVGGRGVS